MAGRQRPELLGEDTGDGGEDGAPQGGQDQDRGGDHTGQQTQCSPPCRSRA